MYYGSRKISACCISMISTTVSKVLRSMGVVVWMIRYGVTHSYYDTSHEDNLQLKIIAKVPSPICYNSFVQNFCQNLSHN